jgi:hypothetical protein
VRVDAGAVIRGGQRGAGSGFVSRAAWIVQKLVANEVEGDSKWFGRLGPWRRIAGGGAAGGGVGTAACALAVGASGSIFTQGGFDAGARLPRQLAVEQFHRVDRRVLPLRPPALSLSGKRPSIAVTATLGCGPCGSQGWAARLLHDHRIVAGTRKSTCVGLLPAGRRCSQIAPQPRSCSLRARQHHLSDHTTLQSVTGRGSLSSP